MASPTRPLIGVPADHRQIGLHPSQMVGDKYLRAVTHGLDAMPFILPTFGAWYDWTALLDRLDGLLIPGSPSNVEPQHYDGPPFPPDTMRDPARDATTLPLLRLALDRGLPILALCRGLQELNVVLGGSLHQQVHAVPGLQDHRADETQNIDIQYGPAHDVHLTPGGWLHGLIGKDTITVNSIHSQGIQDLAPGLAVEARAPDGLIEAIRTTDTPGFALGVQWHPEWQFETTPHYQAIFTAFADIIRDRATP